MKRRDFLLGSIWGCLWGLIVTLFIGKKEKPKRRTIYGGSRSGKSEYGINKYKYDPNAEYSAGTVDGNVEKFDEDALVAFLEQNSYIVHDDCKITREGFSEKEIYEDLKGLTGNALIHQAGRNCSKRNNPVLIANLRCFINCTDCILAMDDYNV